MPDTYNSNNVGHSVRSGGGILIYKPDATELGTFVFEGFTPEKDGGAVMRNNFAGGAGGFALSDDTEKQNTASSTIQIDSDTTTLPYPGCYIDADMGRGDERWVIIKVSDPMQAGTAWTVNADWLKDHFAEEAP